MSSTRTGMGAVPFDGGVTFRVWSPFARSISVAVKAGGEGAPALHPLEREAGAHDYWSNDVAGSAVGDHYRFFVEPFGGGATLERIDPYAREVTSSVGWGVIAPTAFAWTETSFVCPARRFLAVYEIHVRTFNGTFRGVIEKLPYLKDLGVNAILIMAAGEFATDVSLGYNPSHIFAVESSYGGPNGFRELVDAANQHGLAVILDVVYNHFGPSDLSLWEFDGWRVRDGGGIYFYNDAGLRDTPWGPRPDFGRDAVRRFIRDNALRWIESRGADGLRWDATSSIRAVGDGWTLMQEINRELAEVAPQCLRMAEDMQDEPAVTRSVEEGGAGFTTQWSAKFVHTIRKAVIDREDSWRDMFAVRDAIAQQYGADPFARTIYTESHDEVRNGSARVPYEIWPEQPDSWFAKKRSTLGAALVFTSPGIPMLFQGQEFLEDGWFEAERALDWSKRERFSGIHALYRDLIRLRTTDDRTRGLRGDHTAVFHVNAEAKVIAWHRWGFGGPGDDVVVVANFANQSYASYVLPFPRPGWWHVRFNSDWNGYDASFANTPSFSTLDGSIGLGPYSAVILSQE